MADQTVHSSLVKKLAEVMAAVERIPKRGHNSFHNYDYATEADIVSVVRQELATRHVMLIPSIVGRERLPVGEKGSVLTHLDMTFTFLDGESGEREVFPWLGAGTDKEDKGAYKAMTGGEKYFLLKTFLIPTGDDPEADETRPTRNTASAAPRVPPTAAQPPEPPRQRAQANGNGSDLLISQPQAKRFFAIAKEAKWEDAELKLWLKEVWGLDSSKQIPREKYEAICDSVKVRAPLA